MSAFRDRVAVVTGGASGIGAAMARAFAARGARIALADVDEAGLERMTSELERAGATAIGVRTDVRELEQMRALADEVVDRLGGVHVVCNNAGVALGGSLWDATQEDWDFVMGIDFWGVVNGVRAFVPRLLEQKQGGHVVNTASMAGLVGMPWLGLYCAAKFAVVGLSESLARELKPHGIGVSVLCPMIVETGIGANSTRLRSGGGGAPEDEALPDPPPRVRMVGGVIGADEVAGRVVRGIERGDLYILTHPEQRDILSRRAQRLDAMFAEGVFEL